MKVALRPDREGSLCSPFVELFGTYISCIRMGHLLFGAPNFSPECRLLTSFTVFFQREISERGKGVDLFFYLENNAKEVRCCIHNISLHK